MGAIGNGTCRTVRLAYLERQMALGRQTTGGYRFRDRGSRDFHLRLLRSNRPVGMGQSQANDLGLFSYSAFPVERHHWALGFSRTCCDVSPSFWFWIYYAARRIDRGTPWLWID